MKIIILLSLLAGVFGQLTLNLSSSPEDIERDFHKLDLNKDGNVQKSEMFLVYETTHINGNEYVTLDKFAHLLPSEFPNKLQAISRYFDKLFGTNDGRTDLINITFIFNMLDSDKNGEVSLAEFQSNMPKVVSFMIKELEDSQVLG